MESFRDRLKSSLTVTLGGTPHTIAGGAIEAIELHATLSGFHGSVEFTLLDDSAHGGGFTDELSADFLGEDLAKVELEVAALWDQPEAVSSPDPIAVTGLVTRRWFVEIQTQGTGGLPILARRYHLEFADPGRVMWSQHFPTRLYVEAPLQDAINESLTADITVTYDWPVLTAPQPMWFVHLPPPEGASFWDFLVWIADTKAGFFSYDYAAKGYVLGATRTLSGTPASMFGDDVGCVRYEVSEVPRHTVDVCNSYADGATTTSISQAQAESPIRHDAVMRSPIAADAEDCVSTETSRLLVPKYEAQVEFQRMPIVALMPGVQLKMPAANRWTAGSALVDKTWLIRELHLEARSLRRTLDQDVEIDDATYGVELGVRLMQSDDLRPVLPEYVVPSYPGLIEGKVVSALRKEGDKSYENNRDEETSLDKYTVKIPLWEDKEITAPFAPTMGSGNVYLPSYREERVLMALELERARIARLLIWRDGVALSKEVQGEQVLWGLSPTSNTSMNHVYDGENPVMNVARTHDADTVLIRMSEGNLFMRVEELEE